MTTPVHLFNVVSQHNRWLAVRQSAIAGNIANSNTAGFKALDVAPFEAAVESARLAMTATTPGHMTAADSAAPAAELRKDEPWEITHSGNSVSLEQELIKANDVNRAYRLNTAVVKAFHRMLMASTKV
jgi:flagellar basal-body rod protein FlgB